MTQRVMVMPILLCLNLSIQEAIFNGILQEKLQPELAIAQCLLDLDQAMTGVH